VRDFDRLPIHGRSPRGRAGSHRSIGLRGLALPCLLAACLASGGATPPSGGAPLQATIELGRGLTLRMSASPFDPKGHVIERCRHDGDNPVCLIDGKPVFGTDGEMPRSRLDKAAVEVAGRKVDLDTSCMYNPWVAKPEKSSYSASPAEDGYLVTGSFSGGAGSYFAQWLIVIGGSVRTVITTDEQQLETESKDDAASASAPDRPQAGGRRSRRSG
jgi:hypothetical protein